MSYTVLARKWRPQRFEDVVGQGHVSRSLMNALSMGRVAHAFLFSGTRGVGKTTTARILAKALNCGQGPSPSPCGTCDSCVEITQGSSVDVIEIDAASNTGVDNVRELRENVKYAPARAKYKVYIIDEVHMLSGAAFNALLKTLEEPPPHVVFILATTDPHKLPATILSRCQHYDFRRVPKAQIEEHLRTLCEREGITAEPAALSRLAGLAEGSVRDSLSLLDQVVSFCGADGVREVDLDTTLGLVGREAVKGAAKAVFGQDPAAALEAVAGLVDKGQDLRRFASEFLAFMRDLLVTKVSDAPEKTLELSAGEVDDLKKTAKGLSPEELIRLMNLLVKLTDEMKWSANPRISLELALVKAASRPINTVDEILAGLKDGKGGAQAAGFTPPAPRQRPPAGRPAPEAPAREARQPKEIREEADYYNHPAVSSVSADNEAIVLWKAVVDEVKLIEKAPDYLVSKLESLAVKDLKNNILSIIEPPLRIKDTEIAILKEVLLRLKGKGFSIKFIASNGEKEKTLADVKDEKEKSRQDKLRKEALEDPIVKSALDLFGGEIIEVEDEKTGT